jgi:hypothetical protein
MPIRMIAKELYRLVQEVEKLERRIESASFEAQKELKDQLRKVKAERDHMRKILDGKKE